ncbi:carboxymuconolactone decarboxylase family protein [Parasphingorhabdus sp.]|uniref:carboxymuconolactone decarboxylase family protein n=1 Tax=Parasphingorhabdus sp. TaxID=2709688 RepID=UPI0032649CCB
MTNYTVHSQDTAPEGSKAILESVEKAYGFTPNLMAVMAESPAAVEAYATVAGIFEKSAFSPTEQQIILMTNNRLNGCTYCMAAHSTISGMQGIAANVIEALRDGTELADAKLEALRVFAVQVNTQRGVLENAQIEAFLAAGYTKASILDVIIGTSFKLMSNYTNHVAQTPLDDAFQANTWTADQSVAA